MNIDVNTISEGFVQQKAIIIKIRDLINNKNLEPGDRLPSERALSEKFGVSRSNIREAIRNLEFYGLLKSIPQSGTIISNIGIVALNGMIEDILRLEIPDFKSLVETRILLELKTVRLAALRRTEEDLVRIKKSLEAFSVKVMNGEVATQEDLLFHLAIARASGNSSINTLMLMITPEILVNFNKYHFCDKDLAVRGIKEHENIFNAIKDQNPKLAKEMMKEHFQELYKYCYNL